MALGADYFFDKARDLPRMLELVTSSRVLRACALVSMPWQTSAMSVHD